jgi:sialate O-acetylesterase
MITFTAPIGEGMVLQRGARVCLFGHADEPVRVRFRDRVYQALPDAQGAFAIYMDDLAPGGPDMLYYNEQTLPDVYVGDVWLLAGQSNMQLPLRRTAHRYPDALRETQPAIRQFIPPQRFDFAAPQAELNGGHWQGAALDTLGEFSAVGYFFAKALWARYGVPVGLILTAIGGTPIHCWMPREALGAFPDLLKQADCYADPAQVEAVQAENLANTRRFFGAVHRSDPGLREGWQRPDYDDSGWETRPLGQPWTGSGSVGLRKTVTIPADWAGQPAALYLGTVVDWDMAYVNGQAVGGTTYRYPPRDYPIAALPAGRCVICLRVISQNGGGFTPGKPWLLATAKGCIPLGEGWRFRRGGSAEVPAPEVFIQNEPVGLYNGMLAPLARTAMRGALWYQGESDTAAPGRYAEKFAAMAKAWRQHWGDDFPILTVELAQWSGGADWDALRREQWAALTVPRTALVAAYDLGEDNDLHPLGKRPVGERLARCAMRLAYGETTPLSPFEVFGVRAENA